MGTNVWKYGKKKKNRQFPFESKSFPRYVIVHWTKKVEKNKRSGKKIKIKKKKKKRVE